MPPKKRNKGKAKKTEQAKKLYKGNPPKGNPKVPETLNDLQQKFKRNVLHVAVLEEQLVMKGETAHRAQSTSTHLLCRVRELEQKVSQVLSDKQDLSTELTRQYETMQRNMKARVQRLEAEVSILTQQLAQCQQQLEAERAGREQVDQEKDSTISQLQRRLQSADSDYERVLQDSLDRLLSLMAETRQDWLQDSTSAHQHFKSMLKEFGLNPLHI